MKKNIFNIFENFSNKTLIDISQCIIIRNNLTNNKLIIRYTCTQIFIFFFLLYLQECIFSMCNMLSIAAPLLKLITLVVHREDFFYLILYLQRKFLHGDYNDYERNIVLNCKRKCTFFTCSLTFTTLATVVSYVINPLVGELKFVKI